MNFERRNESDFGVKSPVTAPKTEDELLARAHRISGRTLAELAAPFDMEVPGDLRRAKGWVGRLIEECLGATAGNQPVPDFQKLGIELKTLPVSSTGKPYESTYVCTVPLTEVDEVDWATSTARLKLLRVLWVPVLADPSLSIAHRIVGRPAIWSPNAEQEALLRADWESHLRTIREGAVDNIRGSDGDALQIRPKAADSSQLTWSVDERGEAIMTSPRGFYLRRRFTHEILLSSL